jgi:hypothetical protein
MLREDANTAKPIASDKTVNTGNSLLHSIKAIARDAGSQNRK